VSDIPNSRITLKQYYSSARGLTTAIAAAAIPFASKLVSPDVAAPVFPPLGSMDGPARIGLLLICLSVSIGVYFLISPRPPRSPATVIWLTLAVAVVSTIIYLVSYQAFVRRIEIPSRHTSVHVSVGYQRTDFANQTFGAASDWALLQARGTDDEEILRLWTAKSLILARLCLYSSSALATASFLFLFSFAVAHDISTHVRARA
jgi:hypothetical protein